MSKAVHWKCSFGLKFPYSLECLIDVWHSVALAEVSLCMYEVASQSIQPFRHNTFAWPTNQWPTKFSKNRFRYISWGHGVTCRGQIWWKSAVIRKFTKYMSDFAAKNAAAWDLQLAPLGRLHQKCSKHCCPVICLYVSNLTLPVGVSWSYYCVQAFGLE